jgi:uncharacterized membrane protein YcaP (DUF421 family)
VCPLTPALADVMFFYDGWEPIARILLIGTLGYTTLVLLIRIAGKRTLARMRAFDFIITVALGAAFGRVLTAQEVALAEAVTAFALLVALQWLVASLQYRWPSFRRAVSAAPTLLYFRGDMLRHAMRRERISESELHGIIRTKSVGSLAEVEAVVLEPDGQFAVVQTSNAGDGSALEELVDTKNG